MEKHAETFVRGLIPLDKRNFRAWLKYESELVGFFDFCYSGKYEPTDEKKRRTTLHADLIGFAFSSLVNERRVSPAVVAKYRKVLESCRQQVQKISDDSSSRWHETAQSQPMYQNVQVPLEIATRSIESTMNFLAALPFGKPKGGRPRARNLELLIEALGYFFVHELQEGYAIRSGGEPPELQALNTGYHVSLKTRALNEYIVTMISNFLEVTGHSTGVPGITIFNILRADRSRKIGKRSVWETLKSIKF